MLLPMFDDHLIFSSNKDDYVDGYVYVFVLVNISVYVNIDIYVAVCMFDDPLEIEEGNSTKHRRRHLRIRRPLRRKHCCYIAVVANTNEYVSVCVDDYVAVNVNLKW